MIVMKTRKILILISGIVLLGACSFGKKKEAVSDCPGCPPPVEIIVPDELKNNEGATAYIDDAEKMFNKWSERAYVLADELEEAQSKVDTTGEVSVSASMKAGTIVLKMMAFMGEFMQEGVVMSQRMDELKKNMTEEEIEALDGVWTQLEDRMGDIESRFDSLGVDTPDREELFSSEKLEEEV